jgi:signal transduction histidine kinase
VLRVLIVEDNPGDAELLLEMLRDAADGPAFACRCLPRLADARAALGEAPADAVLLDLSLPDGHGLESLAAIRVAAPDVPVVVMTGLADDAMALRAVQEGAQDYLVKGRDVDGAVRRAVRYAVERQRLVRAAHQAAAARDEVLAVVSHDLRNPLSTISMCAQALRDPTPASAEAARETAEIIQRSCDWMQRLISDLLDVTRVEAGTLTLHPDPLAVEAVTDALATMYAPLAAERQVRLGWSVADDLPMLHADGGRVIQALGNLLGNALKFTAAGGTVTVAVERAAGPAVHVRVADSGCGVAAEHLAHIFDRFWQVPGTRRGAGLGLAIAKGIVEGHGGTITVESTPGVGTTFTCTFPADAETEAR